MISAWNFEHALLYLSASTVLTLFSFTLLNDAVLLDAVSLNYLTDGLLYSLFDDELLNLNLFPIHDELSQTQRLHVPK